MNDDNLFGTDLNGPRIARVIDYETTGRPEDEGAEVIELGRIDLDLTNLSIVNPYTAFCRPAGPIPPETKAVHHITEADVADAEPVGNLWPAFFAGCAKTDVCVAHNAAFEQHFHPGNGRPWICTYKGARIVWPDAPSHGNQALRYWLDLDGTQPDFDPARAQPAHRALPDAYTTAFILRELLRHKTVAELIEITKWPALLRVANFGKHRGTLFKDLPTDYLEWIRDKSEMDADTKFSARYWLQKRGMMPREGQQA